MANYTLSDAVAYDPRRGWLHDLYRDGRMVVSSATKDEVAAYLRQETMPGDSYEERGGGREAKAHVEGKG